MSKRKRLEAEDTLRERELYLRRFYESGLIGVIYWNMNGQITGANDKFLEMVGYTREDLTAGRVDWTQMTPPEYRHLDDASVAELKATGVNRTPFEKEYFRKDGTRIPIILAGAMLDEARFHGVAFVLDISERKRWEMAWKALSARQEAILSDIPDIVMEVDKDKVYAWANQAGYDFFGEDVIGKEAAYFFEGAQKTYQIVQSVFTGAEDIIYVESWQRRKDGQHRLLAWHCRTLKDEFGSVKGALSSAIDITEQRQAEDALRRNDSQLQAILESTADGIIAVDNKGKVLKANRRFAELWRIPQPLLESGDDQVLLDFVMSQLSDPDTFIKKVHVLYASDKTETDTLFFKDGRVFERYSNPMMIGGTVGGRVWSFRDITERHRSAKALFESNQRFRRLVDGNIIGVIVANMERIIEANDVFLRMIDYTRDELEHNEIDWLKMTPPDHADADRKALEELLSQGACVPFEKEYFRKDGSRVPFIIGASLLSREPLTWICFILDITARKHTEEALRKAEENFRRSLDDSPLGIRIVSAEGETLYANRAILGLYGYDDIEELRSAPVKKRYTAASYAEYQLRKKKRMSGEESPSEYEIYIVRKTGEIRCLQVFRKTILWDGLPRDQTIYRDITEHKMAEDKVQKTLMSLRSALSGIIQVLSAATEKRDPYTAGHQRRVADLARAIAQELGLVQDRVEGIRVAGVIHDVGKLSIPSEILSKPGQLSKIEYALIQSHPQIGHEILSEVEFPWPIAQIIIQHHERMDGSGYPGRLKGNDILLEARILAVADVIEAMASHRPYRAALGIEEALREIEANKGVLYDPAVVAACLRLFREKGYVLKD